MPLSPTLSPQIKAHSPYFTAQATIDQLQDDLLDLDLSLPSSRGNERAGKRSPRPSGANGVKPGGIKRLGKKKAKSREPVEGECHLLKLPVDLLQVLLARLPPRSLSVLSQTCKTLRGDLEDESIWRQSYIYRYLGVVKPEEVHVLVQPTEEESRGWRKESLARELMLERWTTSKTNSFSHTPPVGLIHSLSLSYPPHGPSQAKLVVGKNTPSKSTPEPLALTPKLTHRQKYEALLAATTRPAPYVLSASIGVGGVVRSDPLNGKVTKGYWGPGRDANFHLRPHLDHASPPTAVHLPNRRQSAVLWGLSTGMIVHTTMGMKSHASQGGRASSTNVVSAVEDAHEGNVECIWAEEGEDGYWVTSGEDGRVKLWRLHPAQPRSGPGKKSLNGEMAGSMECIFTSVPATTPLEDRSDIVKLKTSKRPDPITLVRCNSASGVMCGVTGDGDLRVWFGVEEEAVEVRVDVGPSDDGAVQRLELDVVNKHQAAVLVHHELSNVVSRYDVSIDGQVTRTDFVCSGAVTALHVALAPASPIAQPKPAAELADDPSAPSSPAPEYAKPQFGRFIITGDENGVASIFGWDVELDEEALLIRRWSAANHKITAINANCSLVAIGSCTGFIDIYDPLPPIPELIRSFHANHLSPADRAVATSSSGMAMCYTPNQIILEHDLVVASIGFKVFYWRAGSGKKREAGSKSRGRVGGGPSGGGRAVGMSLPCVGLTSDMRSAHQDAEEDHLALQTDGHHATPTRLQARQTSMLEDMGLDDPDEAVQYAIMLSMEESQGSAGVDGGGDVEEDGAASDGEAEALEAVRQWEEKEKREREEILEVVRLAELREA